MNNLKKSEKYEKSLPKKNDYPCDPIFIDKQAIVRFLVNWDFTENALLLLIISTCTTLHAKKSRDI